MTAFIRKNFAYGVLASGISDIDTQITVEVGHTLPTEAGQFILVIWDMETFPNPADDLDTEIVIAEYSTPNVYNIVRAQEDTLAVAHSAGDQAALHFTAGMSENDLSQVVSKIQYGETISALKVVYINNSKVYIASSGEVSQSFKIFGIAITTADVDEFGYIQRIGEMSDNSWNWNVSKPIFLGENGSLTQIPPTTGFVCQVAIPVSNTKIIVSIKLEVLKG